jgi:hypothetical protein
LTPPVASKEVLKLAWGAMLNVAVEEGPAKARVQDRNNGKNKIVNSKENGRSLL